MVSYTYSPSWALVVDLIFQMINFPSRELMEEIVRVHYPDVEENLLKNAMEVFYNIRAIRDIRKKPSTSELIDWVNALQIGGIPADSFPTSVSRWAALKHSSKAMSNLSKSVSLFTRISGRQDRLSVRFRRGGRPEVPGFPG